MMRACGHRTDHGDSRNLLRLNAIPMIMIGILLLWVGSLLPEVVSATTIYSYIDEQGTPVLTDKFENIPERYRAKVQVTEQVSQGTSDHSTAIRLQQTVSGWVLRTGEKLSTLILNISGVTHYQSHILTVGGTVALICLIVRFFVRSQVVRFLSLWCLIMLALTIPALLYTSKDGPLDRLRGQSERIQEKQQQLLQPIP